MQITSIDGVLEKLGRKEIARICGVQAHAPLMWRLRGKMPSHTYIVLTHALAEKGHTAPPALWGMMRRANGKARK